MLRHAPRAPIRFHRMLCSLLVSGVASSGLGRLAAPFPMETNRILLSGQRVGATDRSLWQLRWLQWVRCSKDRRSLGIATIGPIPARVPHRKNAASKNQWTQRAAPSLSNQICRCPCGTILCATLRGRRSPIGSASASRRRKHYS